MLARHAVGLVGVPALTVGIGLVLGASFSQPYAQKPIIAGFLAILALVGYVVAPEAAILSLVVLRPVVDAYVYLTVGGLSVGVLWAGLMTVFCALYLLTHSSGLRRISQRLAAPIPFLALLVALDLTRPGWTSGVVVALKVAAWLILSVTIAAAIATQRQGRATVLRYMGYAAVATAATMLFLTSQNRFGAAFYGSASGRVGYLAPHALASLGVFVLPFVLWGILTQRRTAIPIITTVALSLGIVLSYARSAYLGFLVIMVVFAIIALRSARLRTRTSVVVFVAFVASLGYYAQDEIIKRLLDLVGRGNQWSSGAGSGRTEIWSAIIHQSLATPLRVILGNGAEASTQYIVGAGLPPVTAWAHNDPLEALASGE